MSGSDASPTPTARPRWYQFRLRTLLAALPEKSNSYARILATEAKFLQDVNNSYFYHEHLEEVNSPCYVNEFLSKAKASVRTEPLPSVMSCRRR